MTLIGRSVGPGGEASQGTTLQGEKLGARIHQSSFRVPSQCLCGAAILYVTAAQHQTDTTDAADL
jgi:hypothetical protein